MPVAIMAKNYSHCPLKKRPVYFSESIKDEPENLSTKPEDLSLRTGGGGGGGGGATTNSYPSSLVTPPISPSSTAKSSPPPSPPQFCHPPIKSESSRLPPLVGGYHMPPTTAFIPPHQYSPPPPTWHPHHQRIPTAAAPHQTPIYCPQPLHYSPYHHHYSYVPGGLSPAASSHSDSSLSPPHQTYHPHIHQPLAIRPAAFAIDPCVLSPRSSTASSSPPPPPPAPSAVQPSKMGDDLSPEAKRPTSGGRHQCGDCGKSYSTFSGLSKHQQFHCAAGDGPKKSFSCKYCDKVYVSLGALKMHIRTHTLPCKCTICGKAFSRPWLLQGHIRTHTGEKPFSCTYCNRAFADRSNLRAHLQTHSDVKKYSCPTCSKTFSRMSLVTKHTESGCSSTSSAAVVKI